MTDTSFLDVYIKMTCDTVGASGEALCTYDVTSHTFLM